MDHWARVEAAVLGLVRGRGLFDEEYARWAEVVRVSGAKID